MKNICTRCGDSVGHRGTDTMCPPCQYTAALIRVYNMARAVVDTEYYGLSDEQLKNIQKLRKALSDV